MKRKKKIIFAFKNDENDLSLFFTQFTECASLLFGIMMMSDMNITNFR